MHAPTCIHDKEKYFVFVKNSYRAYSVLFDCALYWEFSFCIFYVFVFIFGAFFYFSVFVFYSVCRIQCRKLNLEICFRLRWNFVDCNHVILRLLTPLSEFRTIAFIAIPFRKCANWAVSLDVRLLVKKLIHYHHIAIERPNFKYYS